MKTTSRVTVNVFHTRELKGRKFKYDYQFISYGKELRFRGLAVEIYGKVYEGQGRDWKNVVFLFPGLTQHILNDKFSLLTKNDIPEDIRNVYSRSDIVLPDGISKAAQRKTSLKVSKTFTSN